MGRILKKKDPDKKKAQRAIKTDTNPATLSAEGLVAPSRVATVSKRSVGPAKPKAAKESNFAQKSIQFLREVKIELKKVTWPSRKQAMGSTVVVLILVMVISLFLGLVDFGLSSLIRIVLP